MELLEVRHLDIYGLIQARSGKETESCHPLLPPADATAALAARDKTTREQALRDAANECENRRQGWLKPYILSLIQEENQ